MPRRIAVLTSDDTANRTVEQTFVRWSDAIRLPEKLRTMRTARAESGEVFAIFTANPAIDAPVKLDLRLVEADQVATPSFSIDDNVDGIVFALDGAGGTA